MKKISLDETESATPSAKPAMPRSSKTSKNFYISLFVVIVLGLFTGYTLASNTKDSAPAQKSAKTSTPKSGSDVSVGEIYGYPDEDQFPDTAEGVLVSGGIDGEGSHRLVREFQDPVYLTSSVLDLDMFVGHKVAVSGQTFNAKKAGWLMDAGVVEVIELNAEVPEE